MRVFLLSDLHLGRDMTKFGSIWNRHTEQIETNWNIKVTEEDLVLIPGDVSWSRKLETFVNDLEFIQQLPGKKIIIRGNHDWWWQNYSKVKNFVSEDIIPVNYSNPILYNGLIIGGDKGSLVPGDKYFIENKHKRSFEKNVPRVLEAINNTVELKRKHGTEVLRTIFMLHYSPATYFGDINVYADMICESGEIDICVYGHLHSEIEWENTLNGFHKGVMFYLGSSDYLGFTPELILDTDAT